MQRELKYKTNENNQKVLKKDRASAPHMVVRLVNIWLNNQRRRPYVGVVRCGRKPGSIKYLDAEIREDRRQESTGVISLALYRMSICLSTPRGAPGRTG
jgi:hypothetical protein